MAAANALPTTNDSNHTQNLAPPGAYSETTRTSFDSHSSARSKTTPSYTSSLSSLSEGITHPSHALQQGQKYTFHHPQDIHHSSGRRDIQVRNEEGKEVLFAKISEHNPLKPDIQFFPSSSSTTSTQIGQARFRHGKNIKLMLGKEKGEEVEREMHNVSRDRNYEFYLPTSPNNGSAGAGTCRKVLWKRVNMEGGGSVTGKGNRALKYELGDEGSGEVLAIYDESDESRKGDFLCRSSLVVSSELRVDFGGGEDMGIWVLMGAVGICEKVRRRSGKGGRGAFGDVRVL